MATHDYSLANQSGSSFRTDLNNALSAIVTGNSAGSSPSTTFAYMEWNDTSNGVKKIRNSANSAWIELFQLDGTLTMEAGATGTPGLAVRGDLNTGVWSSGADLLNFSTGGTERLELGTTTVFNDTGADVDFRIEGSTAGNLFYVNAGDNRIGIKTNSPDTLLHLEAENGASTTDVNNAIRITDTHTTAATNYICGRIEFETKDNSTNAAGVNAQIDCVYSGSGGAGELQFRTGSAASANLVDTLRLEENGDIKVGEGDLYFGTAGKGIVLGATTNTAVNTLSDYEQGQITIDLRNNSSSSGGDSLATTTAMYTKIGRIVHLQFGFSNIVTTGHGSSQSLYFHGTPFTAKSSSSFKCVGSMMWNQITGGTGQVVLGIKTIEDTNSLQPQWCSSTGSALQDLTVSQLDMDGADGKADIRVNITYTTDA